MRAGVKPNVRAEVKDDYGCYRRTRMRVKARRE